MKNALSDEFSASLIMSEIWKIDHVVSIDDW